MSELYQELHELGCTAGLRWWRRRSDVFWQALDCGYAACQLGTRFIASNECRASDAYKQAVVTAEASDIVLSERVTGVPVSVINTNFIKRSGTRMGWFARWMLGGNTTKHWMRMYYGLKSIWQLKHSSLDETGARDYWQAGKSVAGIERIESCDAIMQQLISSEG